MKSADGEAEGERDEDRGPNRKAVRQEPGNDDARETHDSADRQIDACRNDDESLAHRQNRDHRALTQQVGDVVVCPEAGGAERQHEPHQARGGPPGSG